MRVPRALLLDMWNTLSRSVRPGQDRMNLARSLGCSRELLDEVLHQLSGDFETGRITPVQRMKKICLQVMGYDPPAGHINTLVRQEAADIVRSTELYPDTPRALAQLRDKGIRVVICSNASYISGYCLAHQSGLLDLVDGAVFSHQVGVQKPNPEIYREASDLAGVRPAEAWFVGDGSGNELLGAERLRMPTVRVLHGIKHEPGTYLDAFWTIDGIGDLPELVQAQAAG